MEKTLTLRWRLDLAFVLFLAIVSYLVARRFDLMEFFVEWCKTYESLELDEWFVAAVFSTVGLVWFTARRWLEHRQINALLVEQNQALELALEEIDHLRGLLPICSFCKKIRDDDGYWQQLESFFSTHAEVDFTHGICPDCMQQHYAEDLK